MNPKTLLMKYLLSVIFSLLSIFQSDGQEVINISMVYVEGGTFTMGNNKGGVDESTHSVGKGFLLSDKTVHKVTLSSFSIGKYEVTQAEWIKVIGTNPSFFKNSNSSNYPVENISWLEVQDFISKLNVLTNKHYRLPTEAEWEYAARGGNKSKGYIYSGSNNLNLVGWVLSPILPASKTHPVGLKLPNELGIYDMTGNVYEMCSDFYSYSYYLDSPSLNPQGPDHSDSKDKVKRGGCFYLKNKYENSNFFRSVMSLHDKSECLGFRLVLDSNN